MLAVEFPGLLRRAESLGLADALGRPKGLPLDLLGVVLAFALGDPLELLDDYVVVLLDFLQAQLLAQFALRVVGKSRGRAFEFYAMLGVEDLLVVFDELLVRPPCARRWLRSICSKRQCSTLLMPVELLFLNSKRGLV